MSTPNPLVPQGSIQQQSASRNRTRLLVFGVIAVHVVALGGLLFQGCSKTGDAGTGTTAGTDLAGTSPLSTNDPGLMATNAALGGGMASTSSVPGIPANTSPMPGTPGTASYVGGVAPAGSPGASVPPGSPAYPAATSPASAPGPVPAVITPEPATAAPMSEGGDYRIAKGDTLAVVAKKNGVSLKALEAANPGVDSRKLKIGQTIKIPAGGKTASATPSGKAGSSASAASEVGTYKVKKGDSLTAIAKKHGTTVKELRSLNSLKTDQIKVDQTLKVPVKAAAPAPAPEPAPAVPAYTPPSTAAPAGGTIPSGTPAGRP